MHQILLVEDSPTQSLRIASILEDTGNEVLKAGNGREALEILGEQTPDTIVTDLQMPEMNGLELIQHLRKEYPLLPAVLITEFGSERLAIDALSLGAASYVAKSHMDGLLPEVSAMVAKLSHANLETLPLKGTYEATRLSYVIDGRTARIEPLVCLIMRQLTAMNVLHSQDRIRVCIALEYLLFHFVYHGILEQPYDENPISREMATAVVDQLVSDESTRPMISRRVFCELAIDDSELRISVNQEGDGARVSPSILPGTPESFVDEQGRGMLLLTSIMDRVVFDRSGTQALITKNLA